MSVCIYVCMTGKVKKVGSGCFKIVHEKYRAKNADDEADQYQRKFQEGLKLYPELKPQTLRAVVRIFVCMYVCKLIFLTLRRSCSLRCDRMR